jgi:hypothetical protein
MILYYSTKLVNEMMAYFHLKSSSYFYVNIIIVEALVGMLRVSPFFQAPPIMHGKRSSSYQLRLDHIYSVRGDPTQYLSVT